MLEFSWRSEPDWVIFSANDLGRPVTVESWQAVVGPAEASTVARLWASVENEEALADGYDLHLPWKKVAELTPGQRRVLKLPGAPDVTLSVRNNGTIDQNIFSLDYAWLRTNGQPIVLPSLDGPFLKIGSKEYLLPSALYEIVAAIDRFNSIPASRPDDRAAAWVDVQSLLPASDQPSPDLSATKYLKEKSTANLKVAFAPIIKSSLDKVDATKYWAEVMRLYNQIPFVDKIEPDLTEYVTQKAIDGLFVMIAKEELNIRKDPIAQTTALLKKVFGSL